MVFMPFFPPRKSKSKGTTRRKFLKVTGGAALGAAGAAGLAVLLRGRKRKPLSRSQLIKRHKLAPREANLVDSLVKKLKAEDRTVSFQRVVDAIGLNAPDARPRNITNAIRTLESQGKLSQKERQRLLRVRTVLQELGRLEGEEGKEWVARLRQRLYNKMRPGP